MQFIKILIIDKCEANLIGKESYQLFEIYGGISFCIFISTRIQNLNVFLTLFHNSASNLMKWPCLMTLLGIQLFIEPERFGISLAIHNFVILSIQDADQSY